MWPGQSSRRPQPTGSTGRRFMPKRAASAWEVIVDSGSPDQTRKIMVAAGEPYELIPRSAALLLELTD